MNLKFPFREKRKTLPIHPDIILLLLLFPVSSVQILKVKSLFVYSGQEAALTCHVKLSSEPVLLSICRNSKKPFSICQVVLVRFCRYLITYSILSLTLSRCLSEWDNKANWIDSREMWNFNTNRAGPVTRHWSRARDQRDKLNIYICRAPVSTLCTLQIEQTIQFHRLPASCSLTTGLTPEEPGCGQGPGGGSWSSLLATWQ